MLQILRRAISIVLAFALAGTLLGACGGEGGGNPPSQQGAPTPTQPAATDNLGAIETAMSMEVEETARAGGDTATTSGDELDLSNIDPCALLTIEEVEAAIGPVQHNPGKKRQLVTYDGAVSCTYADQSLTTNIVLTVFPKDATYAPALFYWDGAQSVSGLGDQAYTDSDPQLGDGVWVVLNNKALIQFIAPLGKLEGAKELTSKVIERLNQ